MLKKAKSLFIGDRVFYAAVLALIIPMIIQNSISNFVNLLDNLMVGALGNSEISGVALANQLIFIFNLSTFGGLAGPGIFCAQFYGAGDMEGVRNTFRIKLIESAFLLTVVGIAFLGFWRPLLTIFLQGEGDPAMAAEMLENGHKYLRMITLGLPAFALSQCYSGTLREMGETKVPMIASVIAVFTNAFFNYLLIFGKMGLPRLEVTGAALATVISRYVELAIVMVFTYRHRERFSFVNDLFKPFKVPGILFGKVLKMGAPLLINEVLWSVGMSALSAIYYLCGLNVVSAFSITFTVSNLFNSVYFSMGTAVSVMIGQALGAGDFKKAKEYSWKLMAFSVFLAASMAVLLALTAPYIPKAYSGVTEDVRHLATTLLFVTACVMPLYAIGHCSYFTLRSGGKTIITFIFDSGYTWLVSVPMALLMVKVVHANIVACYAVVESCNLFKNIVGILFVKSGKWIQNLTRFSDAD